MPEIHPTHPSPLSRALNRVRTRGLAEVARLIWDRTRDAIASEDELVVFVQTTGGDVQMPPGLGFRSAEPTDAAAYARDIGTDSVESFRERLTSTTHCFLVLNAGMIVHSSWVTTSSAWTREIRGYMVPPPGGAYVYESFTRPEVRGRGVYPLALRAICSWASVRAIDQVWVAVEADNPASLRAVTKAGFEEAFRFSYRRRLGRLRIDPPTGQMAHIGTSFVRRTV